MPRTITHEGRLRRAREPLRRFLAEIDARRALERLALAALYLGVPAWLLLRIFAA